MITAVSSNGKSATCNVDVVYQNLPVTKVKISGFDSHTRRIDHSSDAGIKLGDKLTLTICRVDNNYQTKEFDVTVTLVEEKKESTTETTTSAQSYGDPYEFYNDFFKGLF